jgi:hypothetical protein
VVEQCSQPGNTTAAVAKRHGIHVSLVHRWAQLMRQAAQSNAAQQEEAVVESWTGASPDAPVTSTATAVPSACTPAQPPVAPVAPVAPTAQCPAACAAPATPPAPTTTATATAATLTAAVTVPAFIALARGQTTQQAAPASPCAFDPLAAVTPAWPPTPPAPPAPHSEAIHIQLHSGAAQVHIRWPTSAAAQCVQWMREGLAPLWQPAPTNHHLADNLPPDKPPPEGDGLLRSRPSSARVGSAR